MLNVTDGFKEAMIGVSRRMLAKAVVELCEQPGDFQFSYELDLPIAEKIEKLVKRIYRGSGISIMPQAKKQIDQLTDQMLYHARKYYVEDAPEISDFEYDKMYAELLRLEGEHPELDDPASPTHRVGGASIFLSE